eukprot:663121-Hanusia_phi.AAC.2
MPELLVEEKTDLILEELILPHLLLDEAVPRQRKVVKEVVDVASHERSIPRVSAVSGGVPGERPVQARARRVAAGHVYPAAAANRKRVEVELLKDAPALLLPALLLSSVPQEDVWLHRLLARVEVFEALALGRKELRNRRTLEQVALGLLRYALAAARQRRVDEGSDHQRVPFQVRHAAGRVDVDHGGIQGGGGGGRLLGQLVPVHLLLLACAASIRLPCIVELGHHLEEAIDRANFGNLGEALDQVPPALHQLLAISRARWIFPYTHAEEVHPCSQRVHALRQGIHAPVALPAEPSGLHGLVELSFLQPISAASSIRLHTRREALG